MPSEETGESEDRSDEGPYQCLTFRSKLAFPRKTMRCGNALTLQISLIFPDAARENLGSISAPVVVFLSGFQVHIALQSSPNLICLLLDATVESKE